MEKTTPHYAHPTGLAAAITAGVVYTVCAAFVALWKTQAVRFFNDWFHGIDLSALPAPQLTWGAFLRGLVEVVLFFYLVGLLYGWTYNKCVDHCKKRGWI